MIRTFVSSVLLRFPHSHTNAAESNTQYFIRGCKYYIKCSRPISARSMLQKRAAVGFHSIINLPLCPQAARILDQDRTGSREVIWHLRFDAKSRCHTCDCSLWSPPSFVELNYCLNLWTIELRDTIPSAGMQNQPGTHSCGAESLFETAMTYSSPQILSARRVPP